MANFNFNRVIIGGRLTANPELKTTPSGVSVANFTVAISRKGKSGETDFIDVVAWRGTADFVCKYFQKGSSICVVGNIQVRKWQDKDGNNRLTTEIIADEVNFVDGKNDSATSEKPYVPEAYSAPKMEEIDEDLPF